MSTSTNGGPMIAEKRQLQIFRAYIKEMLRRKEMRFDINDINRTVGQDLKNINERTGLTPPITKKEFLEIYLEIMKEITSDHFKAVEAKMVEK